MAMAHMLDYALQPEVRYSSRNLSYEQLMAEVETHKEKLVSYMSEFIKRDLIDGARVLLTATRWPEAPRIALGSAEWHNHPELIEAILPRLDLTTEFERGAVVAIFARLGRLRDIQAVLKGGLSQMEIEGTPFSNCAAAKIKVACYPLHSFSSEWGL